MTTSYATPVCPVLPGRAEALDLPDQSVDAVAATFVLCCRPNRETLPAIERAGLELLDLHRYLVTGPFGAGIPHIAGAAGRPIIEKGRIA